MVPFHYQQPDRFESAPIGSPFGIARTLIVAVFEFALEPSGLEISAMKASEIISEIKGLPPEGFAEVSAFMLKVEQDDPALQTALLRKQDSLTGQATSRPYQEAIASARAGLAKAHESRPQTGS